MERQCLAEVAARGVDASRISSKVAVRSKSVKTTVSGKKWTKTYSSPNSAYCGPSARQLERTTEDFGNSNFSDKFQPLPGTDVPLSPLLDLGENPWLDQCATGDHHAVNATTLNLGPIIMGREGIAATEDGDPWHCNVSMERVPE